MAKTRRGRGAPGPWAEVETETGIQREAKRGSGGEKGLRAHGLTDPPQKASVLELRGHWHQGRQPKMAWDSQGPWGKSTAETG